MMKKVGVLIVFIIAIIACKKEEVKVDYASFGEKITAENAITKDQMILKFKALKTGDTIDVKFASTVSKVCKTKGCWMKIDLGDEQETTVKFKDYGFFVPMNSEERQVVVNGKAYVSVISVEELQHFAKDADKSEEEIAKITDPKFTYSFLADGVLMAK
jgi:hypothetical protein